MAGTLSSFTYCTYAGSPRFCMILVGGEESVAPRRPDVRRRGTLSDRRMARLGSQQQGVARALRCVCRHNLSFCEGRSASNDIGGDVPPAMRKRHTKGNHCAEQHTVERRRGWMSLTPPSTGRSRLLIAACHMPIRSFMEKVARHITWLRRVRSRASSRYSTFPEAVVRHFQASSRPRSNTLRSAANPVLNA